MPFATSHFQLQLLSQDEHVAGAEGLNKQRCETAQRLENGSFYVQQARLTSHTRHSGQSASLAQYEWRGINNEVEMMSIMCSAKERLAV